MFVFIMTSGPVCGYAARALPPLPQFDPHGQNLPWAKSPVSEVEVPLSEVPMGELPLSEVPLSELSLSQLLRGRSPHE